MQQSYTHHVLLALLFLFSQAGVFGQEAVAFSRTETSSSSFSSSSSSHSSSSTTVVVTSGSSSEPAETETVPSPSVKTEPSPSVEHRPSPSPSPLPPPPAMPKNATKAVRSAVTSANVEEVATLLIKSEDIIELGLGFTFSEEERDRVLFETAERKNDPDVVSLKGMAKAALQADLSDKLTEVFIIAIYGTDFDSNLCPDDTESHYSKTVTTTRTRTTSGYTRTTNSSGTFTVHREPESHSESWTETYGVDELDVDIEMDAMESQEAENEEDGIPECYTQEEMEIIRENLREDFSDLELMASIVDGTPGKSSQRRGRGLKVIGTRVESWICASCWKARFCNKNAFWCPQ